MPKNLSRTATLCAGLLLAFGVLAATPAAAEIEVHVLNCTTGEGMISSYDAKDQTRAVPFQTKRMGSLEGHQMRCHGQGKGHCAIKVCSNTASYVKGSTSCVTQNVDSGKTLYVVDWEQAYNKPIFADSPNQRCPTQKSDDSNSSS